MEYSTLGVTLKYGESTPSTTIPIKSFPAVMASRTSIQVTTLSDDARRYIQGIRETSDKFDFTTNWDKTLFNDLNALTGIQKCELDFPDGSKFTWDGRISVSNTDGGVYEVIEMTVSITPTSVPVFTAGS